MLTPFALVGLLYAVAALARFVPTPAPGTPVGAVHGLLVGLRDFMRRGLDG